MPAEGSTGNAEEGRVMHLGFSSGKAWGGLQNERHLSELLFCVMLETVQLLPASTEKFNVP